MSLSIPTGRAVFVGLRAQGMENQNGGMPFIGRDIARDSVGTGSKFDENGSETGRAIDHKEETKTNCREKRKLRCCFPTAAEAANRCTVTLTRRNASSKRIGTRKTMKFERNFKKILKMLREEKKGQQKSPSLSSKIQQKAKRGKSTLFRTITSQSPSLRALQHTQLANTNIIAT